MSVSIKLYMKLGNFLMIKETERHTFLYEEDSLPQIIPTEEKIPSGINKAPKIISIDIIATTNRNKCQSFGAYNINKKELYNICTCGWITSQDYNIYINNEPIYWGKGYEKCNVPSMFSS